MKSKMKTTKKHNLNLMTVVTVIFFVTFLFNLFSCNKNADYDKKTINKSLAEIVTFDYSRVTTVESEIKFLESTEAKTTFDASKPLTNAQYRQIFSGSIILGDSITEGLPAYGYLPEDIVFCKIGASLLNGDQLFQQASSTYPLRAFFAFGMNDILNYNGNTEPFIKRYSELLDKFHSESPDTKIFINSISIPSEEAVKNKPALGKYMNFNQAIEKMCKEKEYVYIDNTSILKDHPDLYAGDGIHVNTEYYPIWINNMIMKAGM